MNSDPEIQWPSDLDPELNRLSYTRIFAIMCRFRHNWNPSLSFSELSHLTEWLFDCRTRDEQTVVIDKFFSRPAMKLRGDARKLLNWLKQQRKEINV